VMDGGLMLNDYRLNVDADEIIVILHEVIVENS